MNSLAPRHCRRHFLRSAAVRFWRPIAAAVVVFAAWLAPVSPLSAVGDVQVVPLEPWGARFGGRKIELRYQIQSPVAFQGRAAVTFEVQERTVARREVAVRANRDRPGQVVLPVELPESKAGVVIPARVSVVVDERPAFEQLLWIFPEDPFIHQRRALDAMRLSVYDPRGATVERFEEARIPFRRLHRVERIGTLEEGVLVVGEGVSFRDRRSLAERLIETAERGVPVLCLAPADGSIPLPGLGDRSFSTPKHFALRRNDVITDFDKRLDAQSWPPDGEIVAARIIPTIHRNRLKGDVGRDPHGWPWIEMEFPANRGRFVICGFAVIDKWRAGPTPRYLLNAILQSFQEPASGKRPSDGD